MWLADAAEKGSSQALKDLESLDFAAYNSSNKIWRQRFCLVEQYSTSFTPSEEWLMATTTEMSMEHLNLMALNTRGHTIMHLAASLGFKTLLDQIISRGADVNILNNYRENPSICACRSGNFDLANTLLRNGSEIVASLSGETPLHWLIGCDNAVTSSLCTLLVEYGAHLGGVYTATENNEYNFDVYPQGTPLD